MELCSTDFSMVSSEQFTVQFFDDENGTTIILFSLDNQHDVAMLFHVKTDCGAAAMHKANTTTIAVVVSA